MEHTCLRWPSYLSCLLSTLSICVWTLAEIDVDVEYEGPDSELSHDIAPVFFSFRADFADFI